MRRCLAIAGVFPPYGGAGAVRQAKLFVHLRDCGWEVDVIAPRGRAGWYLDAELAEEIGDLRVTRVGLPATPAAVERVRSAAKDPRQERGLLHWGMAMARSVRNLVAVPDEKAAWATWALAHARARLARESYDAVFTSAPPYSCHLVGLALRRSGGPAWFAENRDPWAGHQFRAHGSSWRRVVDQKLEAAVVRHADAISVISPGMAESIVETHGAEVHAKLEVITNGFDPDDFSSETHISDGFELVYVGTFDAGLTSPDALLAGLVEVPADVRNRVRVRVVGGADLMVAERLRVWMASYGERIQIDGYAGHRQATRAMVGAGALLLCLAPGASWVLTSKVFEYLASGRPILALIPHGDCRDLLERCGGATILDPRDTAGIGRCIADSVRAGALTVPPRQPEHIERYVYPRLAERLGAVLSRIGGTP